MAHTMCAVSSVSTLRKRAVSHYELGLDMVAWRPPTLKWAALAAEGGLIAKLPHALMRVHSGTAG